MTSRCIILYDVRRAVGAQKRRQSADFFQLYHIWPFLMFRLNFALISS